ncbi:conserved hypothetical protein [Methylorubrum populi BJ001]|jgi:hypothetical protein|uniref:Nitrile hydratase beta subunit-like N-terminal domain-containing protein n=1 Tax=Methylorubrum populi (strain ATCC BAA-705 / NCIMB 13946 / BJ001) TaxID=441620 RepID=B1Z8N3_METPB|nr:MULTISPECIES: nitrile hydratase subunit beta [Methylorubrum]ACB81913.1 conserved hypothetical protein [Methylorubrum populi BJ001]
MTRGCHDIAGNPAGPVPIVELPWLHWGKQVEAICNLVGDGTRSMMSLDEFWRRFKSFGEDRHKTLSFYRCRLKAMIDILVEKDVFIREELDAGIAEARARWEPSFAREP